MADLIKEWRDKKAGAKQKHRKFIRRLQEQKGKHLDRWANKLHEDVFTEIDCLDCANCCTSIPPIVNRTDATRIARHLKMKLSDFENAYIHRDEDGDMVMNTSPCPFLQTDNTCSIYEIRPKACREYPHTDQLQFSSNLNLHATNSRYCPAVFAIIERMMKGFPYG